MIPTAKAAGETERPPTNDAQPHSKDAEDTEMMETADDADIVPGADRATLRREKAARRAEEGEVAMAEYRAAEEATHKKTARLRAARLARDASLANPPATEAPKNRRLIGSMRRHEAVKEAPRTIVTRAKRGVR